MKDSIKKDVSMNADVCDWSDEELDAKIFQDEFIKVKCIRCGHIANVPAWIVEEFKEKNITLGIEGKVEIICSKCKGTMI